MNYYEHHLGDYLRDTAHLSMLEDGAYRRLLDAYYIRRGAFQNEKKIIYRIARATSRNEKSAVDSVLAEFFFLADDGWHHKRCDREIARFLDKKDKARRSADARWSTSERNANAMRTHSEGNALQSPVTSHQSPIKDSEKKLRPPKAAHAPEFDLIRECFPPRSGSQPWSRAEKAINARRAEGVPWQDLIDGTRRYAEFCRTTGKLRTEFVMQAATFFGPEKRFLEPWSPPPTKADIRLTGNLNAADEFLRRTDAAA